MNTKLNKLALALGAMVMTGGAMAATTFDASASIASECLVATTSAMTFGVLPMLDLAQADRRSVADKPATATFDAICTVGTGSPTLTFTSASNTAFLLTNGTDTIAYALHEGTNAVTGTAIAYNTPAAFTGFDSATGAVAHLSLTGVVTAGAKNGKSKGAYSDTLTVTVAFTPDT